MANKAMGNHPSHKGQVVEQIDTSGKQLVQGDSGKIFMVTHSSEVICNLPKLSVGIAGWCAKFVSKTSGAAFKLMAFGLPAAGGTGDSGVTNDGDVMVVRETPSTDHAGGVGTSKDGITFESGATAGDIIEIFTDGSSWYAHALVGDAAHSASIDS